MIRFLIFCVCIGLSMPVVSHAGIGSKVVQEALEFTTRKFGKEVAEEGVERLGSRMANLAAKHGDELVSTAFRKAGPQTAKLATAAGSNGDVVLRTLARHGSDGAAALSRPSAMRFVTQFGDDGAEALVRHGKIGEEVLETFGESGAKALSQVTQQNGRRLAMLAKDGTLKPELLDVVRQHGDTACDFIWKNKGSLAVAATLTTFVTSPSEFLNGSAKITGIVADAAVRPIAEIPKVVLAETLGSVTGLIGFMALVVIGLGMWLLWNPDRRRWAFRTARGGFLLMRVSSLFCPAATKGV